MAHIRITGDRKNKVRGFGLLRRNFPLSCCKKDEYVANDKATSLLMDHQIEFVVLP